METTAYINKTVVEIKTVKETIKFAKPYVLADEFSEIFEEKIRAAYAKL